MLSGDIFDNFFFLTLWEKGCPHHLAKAAAPKNTANEGTPILIKVALSKSGSAVVFEEELEEEKFPSKKDVRKKVG